MQPGVGLGLRREIINDILQAEHIRPDFVEVAPENWIDVGGLYGQKLKKIVEKYPLACHGLSLSLGSPEPLDYELLGKIKQFFKEFDVAFYSEHLSYCKCDNAHLHDLLPLPFSEEAVKHVSKRIREVQEFLERKIAIENITYYVSMTPEMDEPTFIRSILEESDCQLLLDVNNVYVNSFNHKYDPYEFIKQLPLERVGYIHMAGHIQDSEDLIIDNHGELIVDPVYDLFDFTIQRISPVPVLLERDQNFDDIPGLFDEVQKLKTMVDAHWKVVR